MSYAIGKAALNLEWTERVARTEYNDNAEIVRYFAAKAGQENYTVGNTFTDPYFLAATDLDFMWNTSDGGGHLWWGTRGRITDMGHAVYMEDGSDFRDLKPSPFTSSDDVLNFNAVKEYGLTDFKELVDFYEKQFTDAQQAVPQCMTTGGYYNTLVSGAIQIFGWDLLLEAAGDDEDKFGEDVLGSIFEQTMHHAKAWAQTSIEWVITHDDMVWTAGPFMHPAFYRKYIFPRYKELWAMYHAAGKKVLFCSDGTWDMFLDDIIDAGADGFIFEPSNNLELFVQKAGKTHVLMGGTDCRTLSFGTQEDVEQELRWVYGLAQECPGFFMATGNHFPANIPLDNALLYLDLIKQLGKRTGIPA